MEPRLVWEKYNEEFPDNPLVLDHIGAEIKTLFVHSPQSNGRDEHTKHLQDWIWADKKMRKVGVGVMKYDNWEPPVVEPQRIEEPELPPTELLQQPLGPAVGKKEKDESL